MDTPRDPLPRIGDHERDLAVRYLQEHMAAGRLDAAEFDERMTRALAARTEADLLPLFADLPEPRLSSSGPAASALVRRADREAVRRRPSSAAIHAGRSLAMLSWPLAIVGASVLGWAGFWWLIFIPIFVTPWVLGVFGLTEDGDPDEGDDEDEDGDDQEDRRR